MINSLLSSEKITLRCVEPEDLFAMYALENDTSIWRVSSIFQPTSHRSISSFISSSDNDIFKDNQLRLTIELNCAEKDCVGFVDLFNFNSLHQRAEVGIGLLKPYRGHGYAVEALQILETYVSETLFLHQLYAMVSSDNTVALKLFEKMGYKKSGEFKDWLKTKDGLVNVNAFQKIL